MTAQALIDEIKATAGDLSQEIQFSTGEYNFNPIYVARRLRCNSKGVSTENPKVVVYVEKV